MTALGGYTGCWALNEVEVCYAPYKTNKDTFIRYGPSSSAPKTPLGAVAKGAGLGRQSTRNPDCVGSPPLRPTENGFAWVYSRGGSGSGWIAVADIDADPSASPPCGPAGQDFPCGQPGYSECPKNCGGLDSPVVAASGNAAISAQDVALRYGPQSTQYRWLVQGDIVTRLCYATGSGYYCVQVVSSAYAPTGARGWVPSNAL